MADWIKSQFEKGLVSIIIPCFNRATMIPETLRSVIGQTYRPIECLIVDDGSIDETFSLVEELIRKYQSEDFRIKYLYQENKGAPAARNYGILESKGEYIQFLDSDDLLYPNKLKHQVDFLKNNPEMDGVYGDWNHGTVDEHILIKGEKWEDPLKQFYGGRVIHTLSFLFRRHIVNAIGPWDESLGRNQEVDFNLRGVLVGGKFDYLPETTGLWREHDGDRIVSSSGALKSLQFHDKWIAEFEKQGLLDAYRKKVAALFLFWHAQDIDGEQKNIAIDYLIKANDLYQDIPEFNTPKMTILKTVFGNKLAIKWWYLQSKK
ncbi:glycosyltransferase family 2 protein [Mangrovimonas sp. CR14]|uniref:glycosyltransferase family 2 protein n=1 Tax=Mangrovimonas sp. CR14 TaxID=2706120 RepID=UPI001423468F|nr:glycosyltransferase family A protein [Mangrovimonas sp. CR14]NIK91364.1 glycosyltransferase family 2 protein [Mangrovimonas sp. CR14]